VLSFEGGGGGKRVGLLGEKIEKFLKQGQWKGGLVFFMGKGNWGLKLCPDERKKEGDLVYIVGERKKKRVAH